MENVKCDKCGNDKNTYDCPDEVCHGVSTPELSGFVIYQFELDKLNEARVELHDIAKHNLQIKQLILSITSKMWPIIHRKRVTVVNKSG